MFEASESQGFGASAADALSQSQSQTQDDGGAHRQRAYIWGTNVSFTEVRGAFEAFFASFAQDGDGGEALYPELLRRAARRQDRAVNVDCANIAAHSPALYRALVEYPSHVLPIMDAALETVRRRTLSSGGGDDEADCATVQVRPFGLREARPMRLLGPDDIDRLVAVRGMVVRTSGVIPSMRQAFFRCGTCGFGEAVDVDVHDRVAEPTVCAKCGVRGGIGIVHNLCTFADKQAVRLQETPESIPQGETPQTVTLFAFDNLVDAVKPGDRVEVTGVFRAEPIRSNPFKRSVRSIYRTYIDAIHFRKTERKKAVGEGDPQRQQQQQQQEFFAEYDEDDVVESRRVQNEAELAALAQYPDIYERLTRSLAPSVWEMDDVKKGLLCQLFGGNAKQFASGQRFRGEINVLLCGDPGTSKSQLLSFVHKIAPRGVYTSGKGSSAVGLTAFVSKDPDTKDTVLESGALVLSDRGICCIDEFDKMSDFTRAVLHEVMEQQTVSIAKSGIVCSLNARTAVLASANPKESRYNPRISVVENIQLPPTLLSRFDLIYLVLDKPNEALDRRLGEHIVSLFAAEPPVPRDVIPLEQLTAYISYTKRVCHPHISDEAKLELVKGYLEMRRLGGQKTISATPRQLESLIRISEALARMRLQQDVGRREVGEALRLVRGALQAAAIDPRTGLVDMDMIDIGRSATSRKMTEQLAEAVFQTLTEVRTSQPWHLSSLFDAVRSHSDMAFSMNELQLALTQLRNDGRIEHGHAFNNVRIARQAVDSSAS